MLAAVRPAQNARRAACRAHHYARTLGTSAPQARAVPAGPLLGSAASPAPRDGLRAPEGGILRMIMFGKPGAGKGTLSGRLVKKYEILTLSTGDMLRQHIAERTEVGRAAEEIVAHGGLLPDELMLKVVTTRLDALHNKHWILDGFPRTVGQGQMLDAHLRTCATPLNLVVNLDVSDDVILSRITDRWVHTPSGRVYNLSYNPPRQPGRDDVTGEPLVQRPDDTPDVFARRLQQFYASTSPLLSYYGEGAGDGAPLVALAGSTSDEIWPLLDAAVLRVCPDLPLRADASRGRERDEQRKAALADAVCAEKRDMKSDMTGTPALH